MGINANAETRAHRLCCQPLWPIHIQVDWTPFKKFWSFRYDRNGAGDFMFDGFGLQFRVRPRRMMADWDRKRLRQFWIAQWEARLAKEKDGR